MLKEKRIGNKYKCICFLCSVYLFFYTLNILTPMAFGDDYVYSFVWEGHSMFEPMSEKVRRLASFHDLLVSQWSHYFTGNGRTVSHTIVQSFLWMGKDVFNFFNALIPVLLIMEIYWCANRGMVTFDFKIARLAFIFFALWAFTPSFPSVFLWLSGACNYLWTTVLLCGFLLPYIRKYYFFEEKIAHNNWFQFAMLFYGIIAGWTNENSICWIILVLFFFIITNRKRRDIEPWMIVGLAGLIAGYALLILAPGNLVRLSMHTTESDLLTWEKLKIHAALLFLILIYYHILLWHFNLRSLFCLRGKYKENTDLSKEVLLIKVICSVSFCMTFFMLFSPVFQTRSAFPGTVLLILAAAILMRIQNEYSMTLIKENAKRFLCIIGSIYFAVSVAATVYGYHSYREQIDELISFVQSCDYAKYNTIEVESFRPVHNVIDKLSHFHLIYYKMSPNEDDWSNVAFSRYYGIKGIRMIKRETKAND